jgi:hypothetical protein
MKMGEGKYSSILLNLGIRGSASRSCSFSPGKQSPVSSLQKTGWAQSQFGHYREEEKFSPWPSRHTDWARK